ncbi:calcium/sodium antiporter [Caulifigura coniformis]|nr:calcium/sodium antiporter [Caulifigura coniformis]
MSGFLWFTAGMLTLVGGAELVVRGASHVATRLGVSPMVIGLTIVSIGTSAPELAIGITAARHGNGALAVGNIAGTNVFNLLFILSLSAVIRPLSLRVQLFRLELPMIVLSAGLMLGLGLDGNLSRADGFVMLMGGITYMIGLYYFTRVAASATTKKEYREEYGPQAVKWSRKALSFNVAMLLGGITLSVIGANWLVDGATALARAFGVSEAIIGLTIVALGTSAPELVTTLISTLRNDRDVAIGNLLGSSIFNIMVILALTCLLVPGGLPVERDLMLFDVPLMALVAFGAVPIFLTGHRVSRLEGGTGVTLFITYMVWLTCFRA